MMKVTGVQRSKGTYQGRDYDNYNIHGLTPFDAESASGHRAEVIKIKRTTLEELLEKIPTDKEMFAWIGKDVMFYFDKYSNVMHFEMGGQ